jgi:predicted acetyltransferase
MIDIRHSLNEFLSKYGGHIGYGVRPSERNKGYATQMLRMALQYLKQIGLTKVMLACYQENVASRRTIEKCNGVLEREFLHSDGKTVQVFWITIH